MNIRELTAAMQYLSEQLNVVLSKSGFQEYDDLSSVKYDINNPDDLMLIDVYRQLFSKLSDVQYTISYLSRPVKHQDRLTLRSDGRYGTVNGTTYYTSGSRIEFLTFEEVLDSSGQLIDVPAWRISRIEHNGTDYYIVGYPDVDLNGLRVRIRV